MGLEIKNKMGKKGKKSKEFQAFLNNNYIETFESFNTEAMSAVSLAIEEALAIKAKYVTFDFLVLGVIRKGLDPEYDYLGPAELVDLILDGWRKDKKGWERRKNDPYLLRRVFPDLRYGRLLEFDKALEEAKELFLRNWI